MTFEDFASRFDHKRKKGAGYMVVCPSHDDSPASPSLSIDPAKDGGVLVKCFAGCTAQGVVNALGLNMSDLYAKTESRHFQPPKAAYKPSQSVPAAKAEVEKLYSYRNSLGEEVYQAVRMRPKSFRQRHKGPNGEWVWTMEGVERVLYNLPEVLSCQTVWIVEGEKDADNLMKLGIVATCNVGGAGKWLDGYTESLAGKNIVICGDNDEPGQKHVRLVFDSVSTKAKQVKIIRLPGVKDASDFIDKFQDDTEARKALDEIVSDATPMMGGAELPVYSMADIEPLYVAQIQRSESVCLDLSRWLPSLRRVRPVIQGELVLIIGDTGTGKTAMLQNIAMKANLKTLMFEMELPLELLFERYMSIKTGASCQETHNEWKRNAFGEKGCNQYFPNLFICPKSRITLDEIESIIMRAELKMGERPVLVLIDYVQLIQGTGNRYEKTSNIAEGLKVLAKSTRTIVVVTSQVNRNSADEKISLHSAKDSGSLENSAGLVLGATRCDGGFTLEVLKSTKGGAGLEIGCIFNGDNLRITERGRIDPEDVPPAL